ncbi:hypothetical protein MAM1_0248d08691 [Mucor ambiguus]|uniref:Uncharacterized protein n=1 Tax=Mucor ambiguus TaxID=91626 RepID=A0A0C9MNW8_9FUNG|nr:hypothetical protein MAM1_0248d08691 [Mucor ambiguus]
MLPSPPLNYHSKMLPQPPSQPLPSHSWPMNTATSNRYSRMDSFEYVAPLNSIPSDYQVLNDASLLFFGTSHSNTIPYQSTSTPPSFPISSSSAAPFQDFVLFEPLDQRHSSSSSPLSPPCRGKLIPDLNTSSFNY